jgi:succinoglycan biosynthesis transport protein ExoP
MFFLKIKSETEFILFEKELSSFSNRKDTDGRTFLFGDKINTSFGGIVITPNVEYFYPEVGGNIKITLTSVDRLVNAYQRSIEISSSKDSRILTLNLKQYNAYKAIDILNELIRGYNEDVLNDKEELVRVTSEFINNRLNEVSEELEKVDYTAEQLKKQNKLTALESQANLNLESERQAEAEIANTSNRIQLISFLEEEITRQDRKTDLLPQDIGLGDASVNQITKSYNELVSQRDRILRNSSEKNPVVINLNNQIDALRLNLQNSLQNMKKTSELTLNNLDRQRSRIRGQLYAAPTQARKFRDIERQQGIKESLYLFLLEKREESAIQLGMYSSQAKIIDNAFSTFNPVAPNKLLVYLSALLFGLAVPIGLFYLTSILNTKISSKEELISIISAPYLGDIPKSIKKYKLIKKVDYSPKAEAFRIIRSNIDFILRNLKSRSKKLFITSTIAQEGKSHTSTNLASSISFSNKNVLLIEMDIRVPKILNYLGVEAKNEIGLTDYIIDDSIIPEDIVVSHPKNKYLDIIPSGTIPPNPSELLMSDRIVSLFKYFEKKYDYIIVDTSAVGLVSDTLLVAALADMFIYVVGADNIDKRQLKHVIDPLIENDRLPNLTVLLNGVKSGSKGYGYGYGYGNNPHKKKKWYQRG